MTDFTHIRELLEKATLRNDEIDRANAALITALRNNAEAMLDRIDELEAGLHRIDAGLTRAIDIDNYLSLDDMATQARDLCRELLDSKAF